MKQGFSSLDVKAIAHELSQSLVALRLSNIYDLSSKIMLLKFAKPDVKRQLVVDAGFRCHLTDFARTTATAPSGFVARLRKSLRSRRVTSVAQVGTDRVIELQFSDGLYRLFLEFFAGGNVILTDRDLNIIALLRIVHEGEGQEPQRIGLTYGLKQRLNYGGVPPLTKERVKEALERAIERAAKNPAQQGKKGKTKPGDALRRGLAATITEIPPVALDHVLQANEFDVTTSLVDILANDAKLEQLFKALQDARVLVDEIASSPLCKGYIIAKPKKGYEAPTDSAEPQLTPKREDLLYEDFHPFLPHKFRDNPSVVVITYDSFNKTVDDFFSSIEGQKLESKLSEREATAAKKLEAARRDQEKRLEGLQGAQELSLRKAAAIEANVERVQEAMDAVNGLLDSGMDWVDVGKLVEREQKRGNPVAEIIKLPLKLEENTITLLLGEEEELEEEDAGYLSESSGSESEDDEAGGSRAKDMNAARLTVDINLGITPWANAREYHDQKRSAAEKVQKTAQQTERAMRSAEQKIKRDLERGLKQEKPVLHPLRQQSWFEKFLWFVSSDGYLVLAGKDAPQSEMLYKRHLRRGDLYCHAGVPGAASVVIKNNPGAPDAPVPPSTLAQAGMLSVCTSEAWDKKAVMAAWWVKAEQVSKTLPDGQILPLGSFTVKGEKNFLAPAPLLLGLGIFFRVSEDSKSMQQNKHKIYDVPPPEEDITGTKGPAGRESGEGEVGDADRGQEEAGSESDDEEQNQRPRDNPLRSVNAADEGQDDGREAEVDDGSGALEDLSLGDATGEQVASDGNNPAEPAGEPEAGETASRHAEQPSPSVTTPSAPASTAASEKRQAPKRGQKAKAKKIANKYKYQDEEDRAAIEALVGSAVGRQRAEEAARAKAQREAELEAQRERRRAQHLKQQREAAAHELRRQRAIEAGGDELGADPSSSSSAAPEVERFEQVEDLVGTPLPGDEILEAVVVCAPWNAMSRAKYRVKLQPGGLKKGKAVKDVLERWKAIGEMKGVVDVRAEDMEKMWPREVELIKALRPEEVINVVPVGKVSIMASGMASSGGKGGKGGGSGKGQQGKGGKGGKKK